MIEILAATELVTIQDTGRFGLRRFGIGSAGALDNLALKVANTLVGNDVDAAAIELLASPLRLRFTAETVFALAGADAEARLDGHPVPPWWTMTAPAGAELVMRPSRRGLSSYIALSGGIAVPPVLGSRSTEVKSGFGGLSGRALAAGDRLALGNPTMAPPVSPEAGFGVKPPEMALAPVVPVVPGIEDAIVVRALPAAQHGIFTEAARDAFWNGGWRVRPDSNRIGFRLVGAELVPQQRQELLSHGILPGVVQVPPSGQPIIQMSDANTCGGYPKIAVVIGADLWRLGQVRPGGALRFVPIDAQAAVAALGEQRAYLTRVARAVALVRKLATNVVERADA
jgi:5-oxoprolinase (ATP-hydrolysing) subunit C